MCCLCCRGRLRDDCCPGSFQQLRLQLLSLYQAPTSGCTRVAVVCEQFGLERLQSWQFNHQALVLRAMRAIRVLGWRICQPQHWNALVMLILIVTHSIDRAADNTIHSQLLYDYNLTETHRTVHWPPQNTSHTTKSAKTHTKQ